ncbi:MAG TPA: hypothetical protein VF525_01800 [Pyrinomonadaceae bacterium]|jgi:hypothetical protein
MKRKLGVALLIVATALAGTPEAVKQFQDLSQSLHQWARTSLGGSFLVYAESTNDRALPDRYDYHQVAPLITRTDEQGTASYGLMASLSLPAAAPQVPTAIACPSTERRSEQTVAVLRAHAPSARPALQIARRPRAVVVTEREQVAREIERATESAAHALGAKLNAQQFAEIIKGQDLEAKLKALRIKAAVETIKVRRIAPVRSAQFEAPLLPFANSFAGSAVAAPLELARGNNEDENRPGLPTVEEPRRNSNKTRTKRPNARPNAEQREFDVAPFVIMASTSVDAKGLDCDAHKNDN